MVALLPLCWAASIIRRPHDCAASNCRASTSDEKRAKSTSAISATGWPCLCSTSHIEAQSVGAVAPSPTSRWSTRA